MLKIVLNTDKENTYKYMWCLTVWTKRLAMAAVGVCD